MSQHPRLFSFAAAVLFAVASPFTLHAQSSASAVRDTAVVAPVVAVDTSRVSGDVTGPRVGRATFTPFATLAAPRQGNSGESLGAGSNVALMGVGVAGIIAGSLIDGDGGAMISIGGGVVALIGLFRYLR